MIRVVLVVVLTALTMVVASENRSELLTIHLLFGFRTPPFSVAWLILASFVAGLLVTALLIVPVWIRASIKTRRQRREIDTLEEQLASLSTAPPESGGLPPRDPA